MTATTMPTRIPVSKDQWLNARRQLMAKEQELTRHQQEVTRLRQEMPWRKLDKDYLFETTEGKRSLSDFFGKCNQLGVYHFMFGPDWPEGCPGCSLLMDNLDGTMVHMKPNDVSMVVVSRAPLAKLEAFKKRMGWKFRWISSFGTEFNEDFGVSFSKEQLALGDKVYNFGTMAPFAEEMPGFSAFFKDASGEVFHTYSSYADGGMAMLGLYGVLDLMPRGRHADAPRMHAWLKHHDNYDPEPTEKAACCH
jgi:predicted dithiol-disulfide oxidoreductase (DUF899 family)